MHLLPQSLPRIAFEDLYLLRRENRDDLKSTVDQVAQVGTPTGDANSDLQRIDTRSGPVCRTTSPTTIAPFGTSSGAVTTIIPSPMLNVPCISSSVTRPRLRINSKI